MCNDRTNNNHKNLSEDIPDKESVPEVISNPNEGNHETNSQEQSIGVNNSQSNNQNQASNSNTDSQDEDLENEQQQKQNSYDISFWLTIIVILTWIVIMLMICFKINCIIASPNGWHILLFSISLLLIAFSLSGRLFRRFYPSLKSDKEDFNLHEVLAKSFDKVIDKLPDLLKIKG